MARRTAYRVRLRNLKEGDCSEDTGVVGMIILKWDFKEVGSEFVGWINLAQVSCRWWAVVNSVKNLWIS